MALIAVSVSLLALATVVPRFHPTVYRQFSGMRRFIAKNGAKARKSRRKRPFRRAFTGGTVPLVAQDYNLAKVGVEGSNPFARSKISKENSCL